MDGKRSFFHNAKVVFLIAATFFCAGTTAFSMERRTAGDGGTAKELAAEALRAGGKGITGETVALYRKLLSLDDGPETRKLQAETAWKILYRVNSADQRKAAEAIYRAAEGLGDEEAVRISRSRASKAMVCLYILEKRPDAAAGVLHRMEKLGDEPEIRAQRAEGIAVLMGYTVTKGGALATLPWYKAVNDLGTEPAVVKARLLAASLMQLAWINESNTEGAERVYYDMAALGSDPAIRRKRMEAANIVIMAHLFAGNREKAAAVYASTGLLLGDEPDLRQRREGLKKSMESMEQMIKNSGNRL